MKKAQKKPKKAPSKSIDEVAQMVARFNAEFPTDADCYRGLWKLTSDSDVPCCSACQEPNHKFQFDERSFNCGQCGKETWITAGTFFENIRLPRPWLARIWLLERGVVVSSNEFSRLFSIAPSTSQNMFKKITIAVLEHLQSQKYFPSSMFMVIACRRSAETPANAHPRDEIKSDIVDEDTAAQATISALDEGESRVFQLLNEDVPLSSDQLMVGCALDSAQLSMALFTLEDNGLIKRLPGDQYVRSPKTERRRSGEIDSRVTVVNEFIREKFQGISRKCLQLYLCGFWIYSDRILWKPGSLLNVCRGARKVTDAHVRAYVSPQLVRIA